MSPLRCCLQCRLGMGLNTVLLQMCWLIMLLAHPLSFGENDQGELTNLPFPWAWHPMKPQHTVSALPTLEYRSRHCMPKVYEYLIQPKERIPAAWTRAKLGALVFQETEGPTAGRLSRVSSSQDSVNPKLSSPFGSSWQQLDFRHCCVFVFPPLSDCKAPVYLKPGGTSLFSMLLFHFSSRSCSLGQFRIQEMIILLNLWFYTWPADLLKRLTSPKCVWLYSPAGFGIY